MATSITIRDVPDRTRDELAARAVSSGSSLQDYLRRELIALADRPHVAPEDRLDMETWVARVRKRVEGSQTTLSASEILSSIHEGRR